jgi:hypothetical protein
MPCLSAIYRANRAPEPGRPCLSNDVKVPTSTKQRQQWTNHVIGTMSRRPPGGGWTGSSGCRRLEWRLGRLEQRARRAERRRDDSNSLPDRRSAASQDDSSNFPDEPSAARAARKASRTSGTPPGRLEQLPARAERRRDDSKGLPHEPGAAGRLEQRSRQAERRRDATRKGLPTGGTGAGTAGPAGGVAARPRDDSRSSRGNCSGGGAAPAGAFSSAVICPACARAGDRADRGSPGCPLGPGCAERHLCHVPVTVASRALERPAGQDLRSWHLAR